MENMLGEFQLPLGIEVPDPQGFRQQEGFEYIYLKEMSLYQFRIVVGADKIAQVFRRLGRMVPSPMRMIVEIPGVGGTDEGEIPPYEVYMSDDITREDLFRAFTNHEFVLCNDGMVGFGAFCSSSFQELFINDHGTIFFWATDLEEMMEVLDSLGLAGRSLPHFEGVDHVHHSLLNRGRFESYMDTLEEFERNYGLAWVENRSYE